MTDENSTTPQPDQPQPAEQPTQQLPGAVPPHARDAAPGQPQHPAPQSRPAQQSQPAQQSHPAPQPQPAPQPTAPQAPVSSRSDQQPTAQYPATQQPGAQQQTAQQPPVGSRGQQNPADRHQTAQHQTGQHQTAQYQTAQYVNPYSAPGAEHDQAAPKSAKSRTWAPVVGAAAAAALLASIGTAGFISLTDSSDSASSLADVGQESSENVPVESSSVDSPNWTSVTSAVQDSVVAIQVESAAGGAEGSGVVIDDEGHVLTNNHVVADASKVQVTLGDGQVVDAEIVGTDPTTDLAVVQLSDPPSNLKPAKFADSSDVVVGEPVMALGNPLGLANTATTGIVSALDRPVTASAEGGSSDQVVTNAIQIDAAVNPGNSGGPLFNASGEVIGITSSIASLSGGMQGGSSGSIGLGFAIPSNLATQIGDQLKEDGSAQHAFLGVTLSDATAEADGVTRRGAGVQDVVADSPAGEADFQAGDVVVAIDDEPVNGAASLTAFVREKKAGQESVLTVVRDGKTQEITVKLAVKEESATTPNSGQGNQQPGQGSGSDQPNNVPDWLQDFFDNQG